MSASTPERRCGSGSSTRSLPISTPRITDVLGELLTAGPDAVRAAKRLVLDAPLGDETADRIADRRASAEGQEGLRAFLEKRPPAWRSVDSS